MTGFLTVALSVAIAAAQGQPATPALTVNFGNRQTDATVTAGGRAPADTQGSTVFSPSPGGHALILADGPRLLYDRAACLRPFAGTVLAWVCVQGTPTKLPGTAFAIFSVRGQGHWGMLGFVDGLVVWRDILYNQGRRGPERRISAGHLRDWRPGDWHVLAVTWQGSRWTVYLDDRPPCVGYASRCLDRGAWDKTFAIGERPGRANRRGYKLLLDELRMYDRALSAGQISGIVKATRGR